MEKLRIFKLSIGLILFLVASANAQIGYYDAPYTRYEADSGTLSNAVAKVRTFRQDSLQSEASGQICVNMSATNASVSWVLTTPGDGLVVRYSVPDGQSGSIEVFADNVSMGTMTLTSYYSWESLWNNGNSNNNGITNKNAKMRFDEVRKKLSSVINAGQTLKIVRVSGNVILDFIELEQIPAKITAATGDIVYSGDGSNLQDIIDQNGGQVIYLPEGVYNVNRELYFGVGNTTLKGAGMWYTEIHFTNTGSYGGLRGNAANISYSGLYLTTVRNSRSSSYKAINGIYTSGSTIKNIWAEHFECGAWIAQYNSGIANADGFTLSKCRFRNNYADGINLCKGTVNAMVEHCNFRNNGDDDMAIWSSNNMDCENNTYQYNTSENCWRSAGVAIYGGYNNKAQHLLIRDNLEAGIKVNNSFPGGQFNDYGTHVFSDITVLRCGTFNDLYNSPVGAIDVACTNTAGTRVKNVKFSNIRVIDSKNDAMYFVRRNGEGFYNLVFENIFINGTGKEYPNNDVNNLNWGRGYGLLIVGYPSGNGKYCNLNYDNIGGNANSNELKDQIGSFTWTAGTCVVLGTTQATKESNFSFYPNPFNQTGNLVFKADKADAYIVNVKDVNGKLIMNKNVAAGNNLAIGENLLPGVYILEVFDGETTETLKFIKL